MSWQTYVDKNLLGAGMVQAAIFGLDGSVWARSAGLTPKANEVATIIIGMSKGSLSTSGIVLCGTKYMTLKADIDSAYGKLGSGGIVCVKTGKALVVGIYNEKLQPGAATNIVEKLGDYLKASGY